MSIGNKIADARKEKNLTQEQLADMMSVTRQQRALSLAFFMG